MLGINIPENQIGNLKVEIDNGKCSLVKVIMNKSIMKDCHYEYDTN